MRRLLGYFEGHQLRNYILFVTGVFWGLILLVRILYPAENKFSIMTHTFSFLGSFDPNHNPRFYFIFTIALLFWSFSNVPLVLYMHRRFSSAWRWTAWPGTLFLFMGCAGMILVALFPDAHGKAFGNLRHTDIHQPVAAICFAGYIFGLPCYGMAALRDFFRKPPLLQPRKIVKPFVLWFTVFSVAAYFQIKWEFVYAQMKAAAEVSGAKIGSHWSAALNTVYAFPLWENVLIYTLFTVMVWLCISVPKESFEQRT